MRVPAWIGLVLVVVGCEGPAGPPGPPGPPGKDGVRTAPISEGAGAPASACVNRQMSVPGSTSDPCQQNNPQCLALNGKGVAVCSGGTWGQCVCMAPQAVTSPDDAGPSQIGYSPRAWVSCLAAIDLIPDPANAMESALQYVVTLFSNADVQVSCTAGSGVAGVESGSSSTYYPGTTKGAASAGCSAFCDLPPFPSGSGEAGFWDFQVSAGGPVAEYIDSDPGHPLNGYSYRFTESNCSVMVRQRPDAEWMNAALSDVFD